MRALKQVEIIPSSHNKQHGFNEEYALIAKKLKEAKLYIRLNKSWNNLLYALLAAMVITFLTELAFRVIVFDGRRIFEVSIAVLIPIFAVSWPFVRRMDDLRCAREVDRIFKTKERLSTAVEVKEQIIQSRFDGKIVTDATKAASSIELTKGLSYKPSRRILASLIILILVNLLVNYTPNHNETVLAERKAFDKKLEDTKEELLKKKAAIEKDAKLGEGNKRELIRKIDQLVEELSRKNLTREEALAKMDELKQELDSKRPSWGKSSDEMLQRLARKVSDDKTLGELSAALEKRDYDSAVNNVDNLLPELEKLNAGERNALSSKLNQMSSSSSPVDPKLAKALSDLSKALSGKSGNSQNISQSLGQLSEAIDQAGKRASLEQALSELSNELSKDRKSVAQAGQQPQQEPSSDQSSSSGQNASSKQSSSSNQSGKPSQSSNSNGRDQSSSNSANSGSQENKGGQSISNSQGKGNTPGSSGSPGQGNAQGSSGNSGKSSSATGGGSIGAKSGSRQGFSSSSNDFGDITLDREKKTGKYKPVYAPDLMSAGTRSEKLSGQKLQGEESFDSITLPPSREEALIPYSEAYYHYYDTAVESLNRDKIPPSMEEVVKNYFDAMRP